MDQKKGRDGGVGLGRGVLEPDLRPTRGGFGGG